MLGQVGAVALRRGHDMNSRLQAHPRHSVWIAHAFLLVHRELLRQDMQDLAIERDCDRARGIDGPIHIARTDFAAAHRDDPVAVQAVYVRPRDPATTDPVPTPELRSASSTAARIASTVASILTTTPLRNPLLGATP